jgi:hypothetical protein
MNSFELARQNLRQEPKAWLITGGAGFIGSNLLEALLNLDQRVIGLGGDQLVEHVHGGGKENAQVRLACFPSDDFGEEGLPGAGIANQDYVGSLPDEVHIEQSQYPAFKLLAGLVMIEFERFDSRPCLKLGQSEAALDGTTKASFQFQVSEPFQCAGGAEISDGGIGQDTVELSCHEVEFELGKFFIQCCHDSLLCLRIKAS